MCRRLNRVAELNGDSLQVVHATKYTAQQRQTEGVNHLLNQRQDSCYMLKMFEEIGEHSKDTD